MLNYLRSIIQDDLQKTVLRIIEIGEGTLGTGCLASEDGFVFTVAHLFNNVSNMDNLEAVFQTRDGSKRKLRWKLTVLSENSFDEQFKDIALCKLEDFDPISLEQNGLTVIEVKTPKQLNGGNYGAFGYGARGNGNEEGWSYGELRGVIYKYGAVEYQDPIEIYQLTKDSIFPGMSGSPLLLLDQSGTKGQVIGLVKGRSTDPNDDFANAVPIKYWFDAYGEKYPQLRETHYHNLKAIDAPFHTLEKTEYFTAREKELGWLNEKLSDQSVHRIGIVGGPGMGKTSIVQRFLELNAENYPQGVLSIDVRERDADSLVQDLLKQLDIDGGNLVGQAGKLWEENIDNRPVIIWLDNVDDITFAERFYPTTAKCYLIVTTRDKGILQAKWDISDDDILDLNTDEYRFSEADALELAEKVLMDNKGRQPTYDLDANRDKIQEILALVGHHPLVTKTIAAYLVYEREISSAEYLEMLKHQRLKYIVLETISWDNNIRAIFDLSLKTLRQRNRQQSIELFCALSACEPQGFSMIDALVVVDIDNQVLIKSNLLELIRLSLIRGDLNNRMSMHPFVREYARELAQNENILDIARQRYSEYYVDLVISAGPDSDDDQISDLSLTELEKNLDAIRHATRWLLNQNDPLRNQKFWRGLRPVYETRAYTDFAVHLMQQFSDIANKHGDLALQAYYYRQLGKAYRKTNDLSNALEAMQRGLELERLRGDESLVEQGKALDSIGRIYLQKRNSTKAIEFHRESLSIAEQLNDEENLSFALAGLAISLGRSKVKEHYDEAIECAGKAYEVAQTLNSLSKILTYREIGKVYSITDRPDDAIRILTEAIELFDAELVDAPSAEYTLIEALINAHQRNNTKGDTDKRTQYLERLVSRIEVNKNERYYQHSALRYYFSLIELSFNSGNVYGSLKHCQEALKIAKRKNSSFNTAKAQCLLAHVLLSHQRPNEALTHLDQGIPVLESQTSLNYQNQRLFNQAQQNKGAALWTIGAKKEAINQRWGFVEYLIENQKQKYYRSVICGRLANWLYSYGQDVTLRMESDEITFVDKMFEEVLNADPENRYIQYDFVQYQEYKILKSRFTSLAEINSLLENLTDLTAAYQASLEDSKDKIAGLRAALDNAEHKNKSTSKISLYKEQGRSFNLGQGVKRLNAHRQKLIQINKLWKDWEDGRLGGKRLLQLAQKLRFAGYDHAALHVIKQSLGNTYNENLYFELTQLYRSLNDIDNAFQCFNELTNKNDKYFYRIQFGDFLARYKKDVQAAEEQYQSAKEQRSFRSEPYDRLGTLYWIYDFQPQKANEFYSEAFSLIIRGKENDPDKISQTVANSLMFYADIGNCDRVEEIIQKMPDNLMNYTSVKLVINRARFACKRLEKSAVDSAFKEALREYQARFDKALPHDKRYWSNQLSYTNWQYGQFYEQFGSPQGAGKHYRRACELTYYKKTDFLGDYVLWAFQYDKDTRTAERLLDDLRRLDSQHPAIKQVEKLRDEDN